MPPTAPIVVLVGQVALLAVLGSTVGLSAAGWAAGVGYGVVLATLLARVRPVRDRSLAGPRGGRLGPADLITLGRATLVGGVAALTATHPTAVAVLVALATAALLLDAVDGRVARGTGTASALGARMDMEVDASLLLVLSAHVAGTAGLWVLAIGGARYAFVAAGVPLPWLRATLPPRYWRKVVAAVQGIVLVVAAAGVLPGALATLALAGALALLVESFGRDVVWLWRHREPARAAAGADPGRAPAVAARPVRTGRRRAARSHVLTALAALLVWFALLAPADLTALSPAAFLRLPVEGLVLAGAVVLLPGRPARVLATLAGLALGLLTVLKVLDTGTWHTLDRPFNPVTDWGNLGPAVGVLGDSIGSSAARGVAAAAALAAAGLVVATGLAARRLAGWVGRHPGAASRAVLTCGLALVLAAVTGARLAPAAPLAATGASRLAHDHAVDIATGLRDQARFARAEAADPYRRTPGPELLTALRGKDVVVAFVESYGRVAVEDPAIAPGVHATLAAGSQRLRVAGYSARSAFLTSPTFGGTSWLAHATLQSGLWVDNQNSYDHLLAGRRLTLSGAFGRAGWHTVGDVPSNRQDWPQGRSFYRYDTVYGAGDVGYRGPNFSYGSMPDQYVLDAFRRRELVPGHRPVFAEIDLVSSHTPWAPLPSMVDPASLGDGSVFDPMPARGRTPEQVWSDPAQVRAAYGQSVRYSLDALFSFVEQAHDDNLVLVVLGDHQPATVVTGGHASHDVPISIISRDPAVTARIAGWRWQEGVLPAPDAPVWRMDAFRDRFLAAYGADHPLAAGAGHR